MMGRVSLVGAGPGDPDLLTVKAVRRLQQADLVFHDALVGDDVLELARSARLVNVGKRAGRPSISQALIHRLLIDRASAGARVVRLKGGDPFVLGRGGEEALALSEAGIPFEVIPGLSSAIAVPALAGIPLTHRGLTSAFVVLSGHSVDSYRPILEALTPHAATVVVLMGLARRAEIGAFLIQRGWDRHTPAATLLRGSTSEASSQTGTLAGWVARPTALDGPGTLIVGEVVSLSRPSAPLYPAIEIEEKGVVL